MQKTLMNWIGRGFALVAGWLSLAIIAFLAGTACRIAYEAFMYPWMIGS